MKKLKSFSVMLLAVFMLFLSACGSKDAGAPTGSGAPASASAPASSSAPAAPSAAIIPATPSLAPSDAGGKVAETPSGPPAGAKLAEKIDIILSENLVVINPLMAAGNGAAATWAHFLVHDRLVNQPQPGIFTPGLATKWEKSDDFKTWTFYLRDDVTWQNGEPFTADDVKFTVENALANPGTLANTRLRTIEKVEVVDKYTVKLILNAPNVDILFEIANHGGSSILSKKEFEKRPDDPMWASVGTGPYRVKEFKPSVSCTLERFDDYWGEKPPTKTLVLWSIPELATRKVMLENGEAQIAFALSPQDYDTFDASADFQLQTCLGVPPNSICFNNMKTPNNALMCDKNFRLAVAHGLNAEDIAMAASGHWAVPVWDGNIWGAGIQYRKEGLPKFEYDPELAKEYLKKSIYKGETIKLAVTGTSVAPEVVQMQLKEIGIDISIETMDLASFVAMHTYDDTNKNPDRQLHLFGVAGNPSAMRTLRTGYYPGISTNRMNYVNPLVTELTDKMAVSDDEELRKNLAYQIQDIFYDEILAVPLYFGQAIVTSVNGIGGLQLFNDTFATDMRGLYWDLDQAPASLRP